VHFTGWTTRPNFEILGSEAEKQHSAPCFFDPCFSCFSVRTLI
jgi:hypothetical protein